MNLSTTMPCRTITICPRPWDPGCAFLDFDNDGWMDIYLVNSGPCDFWKPPKPIRNALYKNNRDGTFTDVTEKAGVVGGTFGMGVAVGDYDNDGLPDIFVTSYGRLPSLSQQPRRHLHRCYREGRVCRRPAGPPAPSGSITITTAGSICLFAVSSTMASHAHIRCGDNKLGRHYYCIPRVFRPTASFLYHNNGDGTFTEVSKEPTSRKSLGKGLGVVATDINNDGRMDLFVANDTVQNFLFVNRGPDPTAKPGNGKKSRSQPRSASAKTARPVPAWASMQPTLTATAGRTCLSPMSIRKCSRSITTTKTRHLRDVAHSAGCRASDSPAERLGPEVLRLR